MATLALMNDPDHPRTSVKLQESPVSAAFSTRGKASAAHILAVLLTLSAVSGCAILDEILGGQESPPAAEQQSEVLPAPALEHDLLGRLETVTTTASDTLVDLAVEHRVGYLELLIANRGVNPWAPGQGTRVVLPKAHLLPAGPKRGIVINLAEQRLYYFADGKEPVSFAIGIGREGFQQPLGDTSITRMKENPTWYPTDSARRDDPELPVAVPPGPDNPLGSRALYLGWPRYLIHGTNKPFGVGRRVSRGCVRMYEEDIHWLYDAVAVGTPVRVVNQPVKVGWWRGQVYLEAHPTLDQLSAIQDHRKVKAVPAPEVERLIAVSTRATSVRINRAAVEAALRERTGLPVRISDNDGTTTAMAQPAVGGIPVH